MSNLAPQDCSPIAADEVIKRDIAAAYAALLKKPSGPLIAATLVHAPEDVIARIQARDAVLFPRIHRNCGQICFVPFNARYANLKGYPRGQSETVFGLAICVPLGLLALTGTFSRLAWDTVGAWPLVAAAGLTGLVAAFSARWVRRDPLRVTQAQQSALMTPVSEGGWSMRIPRGTNQDPMGTSVVGMVTLARAVAKEIRSCPVWLDSTMDGNWVRLDLDRELAEITSAARTLSQMSAQVVARTTDGVSGSSAGVVQQWRQTCETLHTSIIGRLVALKRYRDDLASMEALLASNVTVRQMREASQQVNDSLAHVVLCDAAVTEMEARSFELTDVKSNLAGQNEFLNASS